VEELRHRYDRDYEVMGSDLEQVTGLLQEMSISARPVAAVIAGSDQEAGARAAVQLLAQVRATSANTRRILLVERGAWRTHPVREAMVLGHVDGYLFVPWAQREQWLYQPMTEYLAGWERSRPAARTAFTVIGRQHEQRSHALRDISALVEIPYSSSRLEVPPPSRRWPASVRTAPCCRCSSTTAARYSLTRLIRTLLNSWASSALRPTAPAISSS
jgi:hypothetical protein